MRRREQAETELQEREERLRLAVESADVGTWDFNLLTGEREWSSRAKVMFGLSADADVSHVIFRDRVHPEDLERVNQAAQEALNPNGGGNYEIDCRLVWPDCTIHWFTAKGRVLFEGEGSNRRASRLLGVVLDITERKHAEQALRQAGEQFRTMAKHAPVGIFQTDHQGRCLFVNDAWCAIAGASQEDALGDGWTMFLDPEDQQRVLGEWNDATIHGRNHVAEFRFLNQETGARWVIASATAILDAAGVVTGYVGTIVDLTGRKVNEDIVRASEIRLQGILDNVPAVISLKDLEGRYVLVNRGYEDLIGVKHDQIVGLTNYDLLSKPHSIQMSKELADQFFKIDCKVIRTGELVAFEDAMPSGDDPRLFATVKFPIKDTSDKVTGVGGISIDVTERRKALESLEAEQETLRHTIEIQDHERQVVAYEIHDGLVQYATGALMQLQAIQGHLTSAPLAEQIENVVGILQKTVDEGRRIINGMHATVLDDHGVVAAVQQLIDEEERAHVQIEFVKDDGLGRMAPKSEEALYRITQEALTNFYKHSQGNKVRIELTRREDCVHLEVRDWGVGFTPPANHNGVHGIRAMTERARIAGGKCTIENAPGKGTLVVVDLPYTSRT